MPPIPGALPRIDLWIAGTMPSNINVGPWLDAVAVSPDDVKRVALDARTAGLYRPGEVSADVVTEFFGPPVGGTSGRLVYALKLWPEHIYVWNLDVTGRVVGSGIQRVRTTRSEPVRRDELRCWYHTLSDVRAALGEPQSTEGWWPEDCLVYPPQPGQADGVELTFYHGLLTSVKAPASKS